MMQFEISFETAEAVNVALFARRIYYTIHSIVTILTKSRDRISLSVVIEKDIQLHVVNKVMGEYIVRTT